MDADAALYAYLVDALPGAGVYRDVPADRDAALPFVVMSRTGGDQSEFVDSALYSLWAWAATDKEARALGYRLRDALEDAVDGIVNAFAAEAASVYRDDDPESGAPRWGLTFSLDYIE